MALRANRGQQVLQSNAIVAVDVVLFTVRPKTEIEQAWQVLLVQRDDAAFVGKWSLPGVLVHADETFDAAARRALQTKASLDAAGWYLEQLGTFGHPSRDTRGRVVSVAHVALQRSDELTLVPGSDVLRAEWVPVRWVPAESLAFDHADMLRVAMQRTQSKLRYSWVAFQLLPEKFTLPELRSIYAAILDPALLRLNTSNFKKAFAELFASGALVPVGQRATAGRVGRPADLYAFCGPLGGTWERELPWQMERDLHAPAS
ncbi:MAG: NUDIX hydrolase [Chloroflexi bacterium]|nr:NUDIX hydrolase [Chloroflexota bacterium]